MHSLNLYQSWNTTDPAWSVMETSVDQVPPVSFFAAAYMPSTHNFLIDGGAAIIRPNMKNQSTLYYDTLQDRWESPTIKGDIPTRRKQHTAVSDDQGRIWLWGGQSDMSTYGGPSVFYNVWTIINTQTWTVSHPQVENNPSPRIDHTATMISNKYILIIGGVVYSHDVTDPTGQLALNPVSMSSLLLFDIDNNRWINVNAGGNIPAPRRGHSAVLSPDGKSVIVFGGGMPEDEHTQMNDVFILELATMRWTAPSIKGVPPKPRRYHKAYLVDDFMLVVFGLSGDNTGFDDVNILSTSSWSWITQYSANVAWLSGNTSSTNGKVRGNTGNSTDDDPNAKIEGNEHEVSTETRIKAGVIAGVVSGGVVILGGGIFLVLSVVILKRKQSKSKKSSNSNVVDPASIGQDSESTMTDFAYEHHSAIVQFQKPDNRSSIRFASQIEDGEHYYKPNAKTDE
ncbi:kelch repeatcontaining protein [Mucor ambiguus]|uniref:Kelch repeatcontaining protein n=1 Tax=Mucor ambiguus TaxID=91626 RepID=A0A0C9LV86_9FUNG|nr:kelch repeatcontaining protein [Mucor ambiguus]